MPIKLKNAEIQERDVEIFRFILSSRGCNTTQIYFKFFRPKAAYNTCGIRLNILFKFGYIMRERESMMSEYVYSLTNKAMGILRDRGIIKGHRFKPPKLSMSGKYHDLDVIDLRLVLESDTELKTSNWISDYELVKGMNAGVGNDKRKANKRVADGRFILTNGAFQRPFIIEYIRHDYSKERYYSILSKIEYMYSFESVLVVGSTKEKMDKYYQWFKERKGNRYPGKYVFTFKGSILHSKGLLKADIIKGNGRTPSFKNLHKPDYNPYSIQEDLLDGNLNLAKRKLDHDKANKESENF